MTLTLVTITADGHRLAPGPAESYLYARADGMPAGITSSTRTYAEQAYLRARWESDPDRWPYARPPGTSKHEDGLALDLPHAPELWLRAHPEHGWRFTDPEECWHAEFFPHLRTYRPPTAPVPTIEQEDEPMTTIYQAQGTQGVIFDGWSYVQADDGTLRALSAKEWGAFAQVNPRAAERVAVWSAVDLEALAMRCGLWEFTGTQADADPLGLTGRLIGRNADGGAHRGGDPARRDYPRATVTP